MRLLSLLALLVSSLSLAAGIPGDRTNTVLAPLKIAQELGRFSAGGLQARLVLTEGAKAIIDAHGFDIADPAFELPRFQEFVTSELTQSLDYFRRVRGQEPPVSELNLVIDDLGERRRGTISETAQLSRVIFLDVRRWHKIVKQNRTYLADVTSVHEFTHVMNYALDANETKLHRELSAIVVEALYLLERRGERFLTQSYLSNLAGPLADPRQLLATEYVSNTPLRYLAHGLVTRVLDGRYKVAGEPRLTLEKLSMAYLADPATGDAGLDHALAAAQVLDGEGHALTIATLRRDVRATFSTTP